MRTQRLVLEQVNGSLVEVVEVSVCECILGLQPDSTISKSPPLHHAVPQCAAE